MVLHKINHIELSDKELDVIEQIKLLKSEIDIFLKQGRRKTKSEISVEANQYLNKKKGGSTL